MILFTTTTKLRVNNNGKHPGFKHQGSIGSIDKCVLGTFPPNSSNRYDYCTHPSDYTNHTFIGPDTPSYHTLQPYAPPTHRLGFQKAVQLLHEELSVCLPGRGMLPLYPALVEGTRTSQDLQLLLGWSEWYGTSKTKYQETVQQVSLLGGVYTTGRRVRHWEACMPLGGVYATGRRVRHWEACTPLGGV